MKRFKKVFFVSAVFLAIVASGVALYRWRNPAVAVLGPEHEIPFSSQYCTWVGEDLYTEHVPGKANVHVVKNIQGQIVDQIDPLIPRYSSTVNSIAKGEFAHVTSAGPLPARTYRKDLILKKVNGKWTIAGQLPKDLVDVGFTPGGQFFVAMDRAGKSFLLFNSASPEKPVKTVPSKFASSAKEFVVLEWPALRALTGGEFIEFDAETGEIVNRWASPKSAGEFGQHPTKLASYAVRREDGKPSLLKRAWESIWGQSNTEDTARSVLSLVDSDGVTHRLAILKEEDETVSFYDVTWLDSQGSLIIDSDGKRYLLKIPDSIWRKLKNR